MFATPSSSVLFESPSEAILSVNLEWRILAMNQASQTLYGINATWAIGRSLTDLTGDQFEPTAPRLAGETWRGEAWHHTAALRRFRAEINVHRETTPRFDMNLEHLLDVNPVT